LEKKFININIYQIFNYISNVIFSQSGNDKIFTFIKSVIDYCYSKCSNQVVDSFVELVNIYNTELQLQMMGKIQVIYYINNNISKKY